MQRTFCDQKIVFTFLIFTFSEQGKFFAIFLIFFGRKNNVFHRFWNLEVKKKIHCIEKWFSLVILWLNACSGMWRDMHLPWSGKLYLEDVSCVFYIYRIMVDDLHTTFSSNIHIHNTFIYISDVSEVDNI